MSRKVSMRPADRYGLYSCRIVTFHNVCYRYSFRIEYALGKSPSVIFKNSRQEYYSAKIQTEVTEENKFLIMLAFMFVK